MKHKAKVLSAVMLIGLYAGFSDVAFSDMHKHIIKSKAEAQMKCNKYCSPDEGQLNLKTGGVSKEGMSITWGGGSATCVCNKPTVPTTDMHKK